MAHLEPGGYIDSNGEFHLTELSLVADDDSPSFAARLRQAREMMIHKGVPQAYDNAIGFAVQMEQLESLSGTSEEELQELRDGILQLGKDEGEATS